MGSMPVCGMLRWSVVFREQGLPSKGEEGEELRKLRAVEVEAMEE